MAQLDKCNLDQYAFQKWNGEILGNGCQKKDMIATHVLMLVYWNYISV